MGAKNERDAKKAKKKEKKAERKIKALQKAAMKDKLASDAEAANKISVVVRKGKLIEANRN